MVHPTDLVGADNALVSEDVSGTIKPLLIDTTTPRTETFYINSVADGGASIISGPYTIKIGCDYTILVKQDPGFVMSYDFLIDIAKPVESITMLEFIPYYPDEPSRTIKPYCPIATYSPTATAGVVSQPGCAQPCLKFDFTSTNVIVHTTQVTGTVTGGAEFTSTDTITVNIDCGPLSTLITLPAIASPYSYPLIQADPDLPRVELDDALNSQSECPIETWVLTSDGAANTALVKVQNAVERAGGKTIIRVTPDQIATLGTYYFYITYTAKGGATKTTPRITLNTICGPDSTTLTLPTISSPYTYSILEFDSDLPRVTLDKATSSLAACPIEAWDLTSDGVSDSVLDRV